jgi:RNase P/RNase MRP subunit p29
MMPFNSYKINLEKNILRIRLIGRYAEFIYSGNTFAGEITNETRNTWKVETSKGPKIIPKDQSIIRITINNHTYEINGSQMKGRHEDRIKRMRKRKW